MFCLILIKLVQEKALEFVDCVNGIMRNNGSTGKSQLIRLAGGSFSRMSTSCQDAGQDLHL